ncbi:MAG: glycosyltransferase family 4 protein [Vicinamibacterales bacterium]
MRIGFDARYLSHGLIGGVRTYVYHLARLLPRVGRDHEFFFYIDTKAPLDLDRSELAPNVTLRTLTWRSPFSSVWNDVAIGRCMERDQVDVAHFPANAGPPGAYQLIVTLHDALNLFPMSQHLRGFGRSPRKVAMMVYLGRQARAVLRHSWRIITVSEHARAEIANRGRIRPEQIQAIHSGCSDAFQRVSDAGALQAVRERFSLPARFLLADGIKNPGALLAAYDRLPAVVRADIALVFFTREAGPRPELASRIDGRFIRLIVRPPLDELVALMNLAHAFVFPSWYEGFGLPLVEAMRCGAPIIASTRGSIPEVVGGAGLLFDVESTEELHDRLTRILTEPGLPERLSRQSLERGGGFRWERTASQVLDVYDAAFKARASR